LHWVAAASEEKRDLSSNENEVPLKVRIVKAITPARRPTPLPSFQLTPFDSPVALMTNNTATPKSKFPWVATSPVETIISSGNAGESSEEIEGVQPDTSKIHVKVKHEISENSLAVARKEGAL
jgi:hypothetical protein